MSRVGRNLSNLLKRRDIFHRQRVQYVINLFGLAGLAEKLLLYYRYFNPSTRAPTCAFES
jgi:hypothetical protein